MNIAQLFNLLNTGAYAILTAGSPAFTPEVQGGNESLLRDLKFLGYEPEVLVGMYQGVPDGISYLVPGMDASEAARLGRKYGQAEVVIPEGMLDTRTGDVAPWTGRIVVGEEAKRQAYHSILSGGLAFSLGFDLDNRRTLGTLLRHALAYGPDSLVGKTFVYKVER